MPARRQGDDEGGPVKQVITGSQAVSWGVRLARAEVIAACPSMPQAQIVEELSELCASGDLKARLIRVESEYSAMAACIGASSTGARTFTATSAQGLALMHEGLHRAAGARLPIVMADINRALAPGWTMWTEQNGNLSQRDTGWIQIHCESAQEVLDSTIQAFKLAEAVGLPVMVILDAFEPSHASEPVDIPEQAEVDAFLPRHAARSKLGKHELHAHGALAPPALTMEMRLRQQEAMAEALQALDAVDEEWGQRFVRRYGVIESYQTEDADLALVVSGTVASTARRVVDQLRANGEKVGLVKVRLFRPFPTTAMREAFSGIPHVAVLDRNLSPGRSGIFAEEARAALYDLEPGKRPAIHGYIVGPGGRDVRPETIIECIARTREAAKNPTACEREDIWIGVRS
jgi:pyruvate/2-oxoacid:ferredoxin oxidoreductase alpha subunit